MASLVLSKRFQYLVTVHLGHHNVTDDNIGPILPCGLDSLLAIRGCYHLIAAQFEQFCGIFP